MKTLIALVAGLACTAAVHDRILEVDSFQGYQVFRAYPRNDQDLEFINSLESHGVYDFWTDLRRGKPVDIMVPPAAQKTFIKHMTAKEIEHEVMIPDIQELINLEKVQSRVAYNTSAGHDMTWTEYHPLEDMYSYLDYLEATYDFVTTQSIGETYEGRDMRIARVCRGICGEKPAVWIDGGKQFMSFPPYITLNASIQLYICKTL